MGLSKEELIRRREDKNVNFIVERICNKDSGKPYVFISYKSDDWEQVLKDIVYKLVKDYGLNVYFDGDFNGHNPLWTKQFPENMESPNCKGVLAFVDDKYACSYATLMELLYSQAGCSEARPPYGHIKKEVVPVFLSKLTLILNEDNTGLGVGTFDNGEVNIHAKDEKDLFDDLFVKASELNILKNTVKPYQRGNVLPKELCATMVREVLASIGANDNLYQEGSNLEDIVRSIKSACGDEVFSHETVGSQKYRVHFESNGIVVKEIEVEKDSKISAPDMPKRDGYNFKGWVYMLAGKETEWDFEKDIIVRDIELLAKWEKTDSPSQKKLSLNTTLKEFSALCEYPEFCLALGELRKKGRKEYGNIMYFDYLMAALLRGCNERPYKKIKNDEEEVLNCARWNYCTYAVSNKLNLDNPKCGASDYSWQNAARNATGIPGKNGRLDDDINNAFVKLDENTTLSQIEKNFTHSSEPAFNIKDNAAVIKALNAILQIDAEKILARIEG